MAHACNPNTWETEEEYELTWATLEQNRMK